MYAQLIDSDIVILESLDSYLKKRDIHPNTPPDQMIVMKTQAKYQLYSDIAQRVPRVASYILHANLNVNDNAAGLFKSLSNHALDPDFIDILMQYLARTNNAKDNGIVGALLAQIVVNYLTKHAPVEPPVETKQKKGEKPVAEEPKKDNIPDPGSAIDHVYLAAKTLLNGLIKAIQIRGGDIKDGDAIAIAACVAMNNADTIKSLIELDQVVPADILDVIENPENLIKGALLLEKSDYTKLTKNQEEFIASLKRWVYRRLNELQTQAIYQYLVSVYGSISPQKTEKYLIQLMECGTGYSNLLIVARQLFNSNNN